MALARMLPVVGKVNGLVYKVPYVGELVVRASSRAIGTLAFNLPVLGGEPSPHIGHVKNQWLKFMGLVGMKPQVVAEADGEFEIVVDECPYGFSKPEDKDVCDACMDLDRMYIHLLKGRFEILVRIPYGSHRCRFKIRFP